MYLFTRTLRSASYDQKTRQRSLTGIKQGADGIHLNVRPRRLFAEERKLFRLDDFNGLGTVQSQNPFLAEL
jgi:hypothetical protein